MARNMTDKHNTPNGLPTALPLKVIIVGAGIGGLAAAVGLRRQGHEVSIYERSQFKAEHGAAITMAPNAVGALEYLGVDIEAYGANLGQTMTMYDKDKLVSQVSLLKAAPKWQNKYLMAHRVDLHTALRDAATSLEGPGLPVTLHLGAKVKRVATEPAMVEFEDGTAVFGDAVIGADGIASVSRAAISDTKPFPVGQSCFRFTLDRQAAMANPAVHDFIKQDGDFKIMSAGDRAIVMYPARWNKVLSVAVIHPDQESGATSSEYNRSGDKDAMLAVTKVFGPQARALLEMADPANVKLWKLYDMAVLDRWALGRFALLGDAAHPFMPFQAQGGAQAIEDAVALAEVLPLGTQIEEIADRLKLYQDIRKDRADLVQERTRISGRHSTDYLAQRARSAAWMQQTFIHNEFHNSAHKLRQHLYSQQPRTNLNMPTAFGPLPNARQDAQGASRRNEGGMCRTTSIEFKTSSTLLKNFLPNSSFAFVNKAVSVVPAVLKIQEFSNVKWLGEGEGYKTLGLYIPGIEYKKADGKIVTGTFPVAVFEDQPEIVTSDREELGLPAFYADLEGGLSANTEAFTFRASRKGATFASVEIKNLQITSEPTSSIEPEDDMLTWRYLPKIGASAKASIEHAVCIPGEVKQDHEVDGSSSWTSAEAQISWSLPQSGSIPALENVIKRLAELPNFGIVEATVKNGAIGYMGQEAYEL